MVFDDFALSSVILELKYGGGHLYWDKCGETISDIQKNNIEWKWNGTSAESAELVNPYSNMTLMFNYNYIRFNQNEVDNLNQLKESAESIVPIIVKKFKIEKYQRIGNRYRYVFPLKNPEEGKKIVQNSSLVVIPGDKLALFGENATKTSFVVRFGNNNKQYRVELIVIKRDDIPRNIKVDERFNPKHGLLVDVDIAIIDEVNAAEFNCSDFIQANKKFLENNLVEFVKK